MSQNLNQRRKLKRFNEKPIDYKTHQTTDVSVWYIVALIISLIIMVL